MSTLKWPDWWDYDLDLSPHLVKRMQDRGFTEIDLRAMFADAEDWYPSIVPQRFIITTRRNRRKWEIVVEPDMTEKRIVVITAYGVE